MSPERLPGRNQVSFRRALRRQLQTSGLDARHATSVQPVGRIVLRLSSSGLVKILRELSSHTALRTNYLQLVDLNIQPRRYSNCCATRLCFVAPVCNACPCKRTIGVKTCKCLPVDNTGRTTSLTSIIFKEACFNTTATTPTAIPVYPQHGWFLDDP